MKDYFFFVFSFLIFSFFSFLFFFSFLVLLASVDFFCFVFTVASPSFVGVGFNPEKFRTSIFSPFNRYSKKRTLQNRRKFFLFANGANEKNIAILFESLSRISFLIVEKKDFYVNLRIVIVQVYKSSRNLSK